MLLLQNILVKLELTGGKKKRFQFANFEFQGKKNPSVAVFAAGLMAGRVTFLWRCSRWLRVFFFSALSAARASADMFPVLRHVLWICASPYCGGEGEVRPASKFLQTLLLISHSGLKCRHRRGTVRPALGETRVAYSAPESIVQTQTPCEALCAPGQYRSTLFAWAPPSVK